MAKANWIRKETAEILGVLGVIASLIFVALEIRQNTSAVRSATIQAISEGSHDSNYRLAENPDLLAIIRKADSLEPLTIGERDRLFSLYTAIMRLNQNRFQQLRLGVLDEDTLFQVGGRGRFYRGPFFAEYWAETRQDHSVEFQEFVERELLPLSTGTTLVSDDVESIRETERQRLRALVEADMDVANRLHADDFQLISPAGVVRTKEEYLGNVASGYSEYLAWEPGPIEVRLFGDVAVIRYRSELEIILGGASLGRRPHRHTGHYEMRDGSWQIVWFQATVIE